MSILPQSISLNLQDQISLNLVRWPKENTKLYRRKIQVYLYILNLKEKCTIYHLCSFWNIRQEDKNALPSFGLVLFLKVLCFCYKNLIAPPIYTLNNGLCSKVLNKNKYGRVTVPWITCPELYVNFVPINAIDRRWQPVFCVISIFVHSKMERTFSWNQRFVQFPVHLLRVWIYLCFA